MKKMQIALGLLSLGLMSASYAVTFDLSVTPNSGGSSSSTTTKQWNVAGGGWVKASSYYTSNTSASSPATGLTQVSTAVYGGSGVGVASTGESSSAPYHAIDNNAGYEFLLLEFDSLYSANSFKIGYSGRSDSASFDTNPDMQIWTGPSTGTWATTAGLNLDTINACYTGCTNTFSVLGFNQRTANNDVVVGSNTSITGAGNASGRYMIVSGALASGGNDAFKFSTITASKVPEPSTVALFGLGMLGFLLPKLKRKS